MRERERDRERETRREREGGREGERERVEEREREGGRERAKQQQAATLSPNKQLQASEDVDDLTARLEELQREVGMIYIYV